MPRDLTSLALNCSYVHLEHYAPRSHPGPNYQCHMCDRVLSPSDFRAGYQYNDAPSVEMGFEYLCEPCLAKAIGWLQLEIWKRKCRL